VNPSDSRHTYWSVSHLKWNRYHIGHRISIFIELEL
jgi:hypothetical protein